MAGLSSQSSEGAAETATGTKAVGFKAVVFDFNQTLTTVPSIPKERIEALILCDKEPDTTWLRKVAFGGDTRLEQLLHALDILRTCWGSQLFVASFAQKEKVTKSLELIGALAHFGDAAPGCQVFGGEELEGSCKGDFLKRLAFEQGWKPEEVLFLDDQADNIRSAAGICQTFFVRGERGLSLRDLSELVDTGGSGLRGLQFAGSLARKDATVATHDGGQTSARGDVGQDLADLV